MNALSVDLGAMAEAATEARQLARLPDRPATLLLSMMGHASWQMALKMDGDGVCPVAVDIAIDHERQYARVHLTFRAKDLRASGAWEIPPDAAYVTLEVLNGRWVVHSCQTLMQAALLREGRR